MSAHFVHRHVFDKRSISQRSSLHANPTTSPLHRLDRPHSTTLTYATPLETFLLLVAILTLLALVIWLAWMGLQGCIKFTREKMDDLDVGKRTKKDVKKVEEAPKKMFRFGLDVGRSAKGFLDGFVRGEQAGRERYGERRGLLRDSESGQRPAVGLPRGVYIQGYGYDRERYGDGTNDSTNTRHTSMSLTHECGGQGAVVPRRKSWDA